MRIKHRVRIDLMDDEDLGASTSVTSTDDLDDVRDQLAMSCGFAMRRLWDSLGPVDMSGEIACFASGLGLVDEWRGVMPSEFEEALRNLIAAFDARSNAISDSLTSPPAVPAAAAPHEPRP